MDESRAHRRVAALVGRMPPLQSIRGRGLDPNRFTNPVKPEEAKQYGGAPPGPRRDTYIGLRLSEELLGKLDASAVAAHTSRSQRLREIVEAAVGTTPAD